MAAVLRRSHVESSLVGESGRGGGGSEFRSMVLSVGIWIVLLLSIGPL